MLKHCPTVNMELPAEGAQRRFCYPTENTCPSDASKEARDGCERGPTAVVYSSKTKKNYRNQHCMACHHLNPADATCGLRELYTDFFPPKSFEVVMNFVTFYQLEQFYMTREVYVKCADHKVRISRNVYYKQEAPS
jgi:hypothetical protein